MEALTVHVDNDRTRMNALAAPASGLPSRIATNTGVCTIINWDRLFSLIAVFRAGWVNTLARPIHISSGGNAVILVMLILAIAIVWITLVAKAPITMTS